MICERNKLGEFIICYKLQGENGNIKDVFGAALASSTCHEVQHQLQMAKILKVRWIMFSEPYYLM